ncbi:MAG TPA: hypothetical protein VNA04_12200 [Thermoanaerobaculia bacterium]|nr:hypothetical protein [Thermoanaerobaculia bacterium]
MTALSIVTLGDVHAEHLAPLSERFDRLEQLVLDVSPRDPLSRHRPEFNRAVDAASADWVLVVRERETVGEELAVEIAAAAREARAWGFRIPHVPYYAGRPLRIGRGEGEVRLFHKRHYLRFAQKGEWEEIAVQGTIVRLPSPLRTVTFESVAEHRAYLERTAVPHSALRRTLIFLRDAIGTGTADRNTLRYIWTEAGFDRG